MGKFSGYHSNRGIMVAPAINGKFHLEDAVIVETNGGLHLRAGRTGPDN